MNALSSLVYEVGAFGAAGRTSAKRQGRIEFRASGHLFILPRAPTRDGQFGVAWMSQRGHVEGIQMNGMEDEFLDLRGELKRVGPGPDRRRLEQIREELDALVERLQTRVPRGERYDRLVSLSEEITELLGAAIERMRIAANVNRVKQEREAYDAVHPTILSPQRSALADWKPRDENAIARSLRENQRGYERGR
ncbi:hypothetical protein [Nocardia sp. NPDC058705]|uniref:hypothetical protein n=1 Tax=Nocardia sp. NPDC058705 TaxID=3346609 RepID=UPI00368165BF